MCSPKYLLLAFLFLIFVSFSCCACNPSADLLSDEAPSVWRGVDHYLEGEDDIAFAHFEALQSESPLAHLFMSSRNPDFIYEYPAPPYLTRFC